MLTKLLIGISRNRYLFSTAQHITDWQYVAKIHKSLKESNINEAIKHLINSHLDNIILDRQTFYNMHLKMVQSKSALSYQELAYKLYRQSFSPHILMKDWMKILLETKDSKTIQLLKKDYQILNMQIPTILLQKPIQKEKGIINSAVQSQKNSGQVSSTTKHGRKKAIRTNNDKKQQIKLDVFDHKKLNQRLMKLQQFSNALKAINWKITIHDLEICLDDFDEEDISEIAQHHNNYINEGNFEPNLSDLLEALKIATKIKIGKIEIQDNKGNIFKLDQ